MKSLYSSILGIFIIGLCTIAPIQAEADGTDATIATPATDVGICPVVGNTQEDFATARQCFLRYYFFKDGEIPEDAYPTADQIKLLDKVFQHPSWVAALGTNLKIFLNEENKDDPNLQPVFAAPASLRTALNRTSAQLDNNISKERDLKTAIIAWSNFLLPLAAVLAVVALVWAGFLYITATEDESQIDQAKKIIWVTTIGIVLIIGSYAIVNTLLQAVQ